MSRFIKHSSLSAYFSDGERREFGSVLVGLVKWFFFFALLMAVGGVGFALAK